MIMEETLARRHPPMSATATLTNCYVPLPMPPHAEPPTIFDPFARPTDPKHDPDTDKSDRTPSVRGPRGLRHIHLESAVLSQSSGSALVEWGHTKVMVSVRGPRPVNCSGMNAVNNGGGLVCEVRYMSHIGIRMETLAQNSSSQDFSSKSSGGARIPRDALTTAQDISQLSSGGSLCAPAAFFDETYLSRRLMEALTPAVKLEGLGNKMCIEIYITVFQSDGCVLNAAVAGASLALSDAGVGMRDLVCASSAAIMKVEDAEQKVSYRAIADPTEEEVLQALGLVTIAMMPNWREVTVLDQFGKMPLDGSSEAMDLARDGCVTLHRLLKNCLVNGYSRS